MNLLQLYSLLCLITVISCNDNSGNQSIEYVKKDSMIINNDKVKKGLDVEPEIKNTDSLQILFYDDPNGDSLRYTRFYKYVSTNNSSVIGNLLESINQPFEQRSEIKKCRSEGKLYLYRKGEPLKTIYFSTRGGSCRYLYFIKDGNFLYFNVSDKMLSSLKENKSSAKRP